MTKILRTIYLDTRLVEKLVRLSTKTRIPQAVLVREGIDLMLKKYEKKLKRQL
jgi:predicted DNA-binding protein